MLVDRRRGVDKVVARLIIVLSCGTIALTTWISFRPWDAMVRFVLHPLRLQEVHALLTGLLSSNLMVLQVIFMARLPWLERAWGRRMIMQWHRRLGYWSFWLMVAHVLLFVLQRSLRDPARPGLALWQLFVAEPWMLPASIGTLLVLAVVASSIASARRKLRYETWHLIHLWAYVGMGLALPHQLVSRDFMIGWTTIYWWTLYLLALASVLCIRVGLPVFRSVYHHLRVSEVRVESTKTVSVIMEGRRLGRLRSRSGQFFVWRFLGSPGRSRGHPYSMSQAPTGDRLRVTVDTSGDGGRRAAGLRVGSRVLIEGPYGAVIADRRRHRRMLMSAAGVGITPFRSIVEDHPLHPGEATLIYRFHDQDQLVFGGELQELADRRGVQLVLLIGPRRSDWSWLPAGTGLDDAAALHELVPDVSDRDVFLCGPSDWVTAAHRAARAAGVAARDLHTEDFSW